MPDYAKMKDELALPENAALTDQQIADAWEAPINVVVDIPVPMIEGYLRARILTGGFRRFIATPPVGATVETTDGFADMLGLIDSPNANTLKMDDPVVADRIAQVWADAEQYALITPEQHNDLMAMGVNTTTRAIQLGLIKNVHDTVGEIAAARIWPGVSENG
jgi:hypothetical protein